MGLSPAVVVHPPHVELGDGIEYFALGCAVGGCPPSALRSASCSPVCFKDPESTPRVSSVRLPLPAPVVGNKGTTAGSVCDDTVPSRFVPSALTRGAP